METVVKKKKHNFLRASVFVVLTLCVLNVIGRGISVFAINDYLFRRIVDFYKEEKGSLDAVMLGPSSTYAFWEPTTAWEEYGIACYPYATAQQPLASTRFLIEECRKTQPDSLYCININLFLVEGVSNAQIHFLSDVMPPSWTRVKMIHYLADLGDYNSPSQLFEFYQPIFAMHSRWKRVHLPKKLTSSKGCKGASVDPQFINGHTDMSGAMMDVDKRAPLTDEVVRELNILLDYLDENEVNACFFLSPSVFHSDTLPGINSLMDHIRAAGYTVYDGLEHFDETRIYLSADYMDASHTNISGAEKFTRWLGGRLVEDYGFEDKRGHPDYLSWDESVAKYDRVVRIIEF